MQNRSRGDYPTHSPVVIEIATEKLEVETRELQKPTNFAILLEEKDQKDHEDENKAIRERNRGKPDGEEEKEKTISQIHKRNAEQLHEHMDEQIAKESTGFFRHRKQKIQLGSGTSLQQPLRKL